MSETDAASTPFATEHGLSSVVRRFSSWKNRHEPADHSPGSHELSYEEAARSSRFSHNALRRDLEIAVAAAPADREPEKENEVPVQVADGMGVLPPPRQPLRAKIHVGLVPHRPVGERERPGFQRPRCEHCSDQPWHRLPKRNPPWQDKSIRIWTRRPPSLLL
jgi:hypothetical protein